MTRIEFEKLALRAVEDAEGRLVRNQNVGVLRNVRDKAEIFSRQDVRDEHGEAVEFQPHDADGSVVEDVERPVRLTFWERLFIHQEVMVAGHDDFVRVGQVAEPFYKIQEFILVQSVA